jgi:hypothetical protein
MPEAYTKMPPAEIARHKIATQPMMRPVAGAEDLRKVPVVETDWLCG